MTKNLAELIGDQGGIKISQYFETFMRGYYICIIMEYCKFYLNGIERVLEIWIIKYFE